MKIAVCIKQVPIVSMLKFDNETRRVVRDGVPNEVNPFDMLAVSLAVGLKTTMPMEVVVYTMGPPQAREALVQCMAIGADRAVHLNDRAFAGSDTLATARALSLALQKEDYDLIICGRNSVDAETGQVGPEVAEMLGLPQVTGVKHLEVGESGDRITAQKVTENGYDEVSCPLPALITVTEEIGPEVFPRRDAVEAAQSKPVVELTAADLTDDTSVFGLEGSPTWVNDIYSIESKREQIVVRDKPVEEAVAELLDYLDKRGVLGGTSQSSEAIAVPRGPRREKGDMGAIWVVAELLGDEIRPVTLELLGRASELATEHNTSVEAVLVGEGVEGHATNLTAYGADAVLLADDTRLAHYDTEIYTSLLVEAIQTHKPYAVLLGSSVDGRDLASRVAGRMRLGLTGDCIGLEIDDEGRLVQLKPAFGGNIVAPILSKTLPNMATLRPGILTPVAPDESLEPVIKRLALDNLGSSKVELISSYVEPSEDGAEIEHAERVVCVGMGVGGPENLGVIRELSDALGAAIGATRDVTDMEWLPRHCQIGLSGKSVAPELYIGIGIRGVFNHTVGIQKAGTVVAINNSARSPIFKAADFGIVGDYAEVVPALVEALKNR